VRRIRPCLWFDGVAEEAATFYVSLFEDGRITGTSPFPEGMPGRAGDVMTVEFELAGQAFTGLNGGSAFSFTPAVSFFVGCEDQAEIDRLWDALTAGGEPQPCGWLVDRFGVSWQIVPTAIGDLLAGGGDPARGKRVAQSLLQMGKIDLAALQAAYDAA
jgi:predicted 3-demethylubiquinone-9 3-methyltransferase (glyoxalase superfamily)